METKNIDSRCINTIRLLAADMTRAANSGHPGAPMGMAPVAFTLWTQHMRFSASNPKWLSRDRFVLSNGHGCALQYSMLHLTGYDVTMDDLKNFRQLNSKTPGHPEAHMTPGVEVTTGPLGQGIAQAVGLAVAEAHLSAVYNKPDFPIFDNYTYVFCGDGCLQEGVTGEAASLAGHLKLGKLIVVYDDNNITIDGETNLSYSDNVPVRFQGYNWHTLTVHNGDSDIEAISKALDEAKSVKDKPSIICLKTTIGFGSKHQGKEKVHGTPLEPDDIATVKTKFGFDPEQKFFVANDVRAVFAQAAEKGRKSEEQWNAMFASYEKKYPNEAKEIQRRFKGELPDNWESKLPTFKATDKADATRNISGTVLNAIAPIMPELMGGSADLTPSTKTQLKCTTDFQHDTPTGRYLRFGVREFGMAALGNGMAAYGGFIPFTSTFLNFIEYAFPAYRLSALSEFQHILVMTHDSIGLGEDGPTHQPIEALSLTRATPNFYTFRPADGNEVSGSYQAALKLRHSPSVIALSRQNLPHLEGSSLEGVQKGGYVLADCKDDPDVILVSTGSELSICVEAAKLHLTPKLKVRVVSMPCTELFDKQSAEYRASVLKPGVPTISVEALSVTGWEKYSHYSIGMRSFGKSAPDKDCYKYFGFTAPAIAESVNKYLATVEKLAAGNKQLAKAGLLQTHMTL